MLPFILNIKRMASGMGISSNVQKAKDAVNTKINAGKRIPFEYKYAKSVARLCGMDLRKLARYLSWKPMREGGRQSFDDFAYNLE
ncbi:hypothetical protein [Photobacterium sanguinicancri]|uniref:hypothetical protein n=1 Tax=Photobacterium sanguinicancri TaxID=875932 RepID=UPI0026E3A9D4|nr:hypothetical protein [Photobacterium sanguinicancri]MDO6500915.1 hypothetical protein [Photobacterium sanguinicancri]